MEIDSNINRQDEDEMVIENDPRKGISSNPESGMDVPTFTALHYALATKVDGIVVRQTEQAQNLSAIAAEMRIPKPIPWGSIVSLIVGIFAVMGTIGGLVHQSISDRIEVNTKELREVERRGEKRDTDLVGKEQYNDAILLLRETSKRLEDMQVAQRKTEQEINVTKAEFSAIAGGIKDRQLRNEAYIEEARKAAEVHQRINALYELYKQLQTQIYTQLQSQVPQIRQQLNGK